MTIIASYPLGRAWHVVYTVPRGEFQARDSINSAGFPVFLPIERRKIYRRRKRVMVEAPLFSRYLFARFDIEREDWGAIQSADGVVTLVLNNQVPVRVPDAAIDKLRLAESMGLLDRTAAPKVGMAVLATEGPFVDWVGKIMRARTGDRADVLFKLFGAERLVNMPLEKLREVA